MADSAAFRTNRLLAALPGEEYADLAPHLTTAYFGIGDTLYRAGERAGDVYFPLTGTASLVGCDRNGGKVEVGTIGREGLVGLPALYGTDGGPLETFAQVPGDYARLPVAVLRAAAAPGTDLYRLLNHFNQALYVLAAVSAACNGLHPVAVRCARWLLLTHDRCGRDTFTLTHEYLGYMLGVGRPSVTVAMGILQAAGLIAYHHGEVAVLDRPGLEGAACECYATITDEYDRLLGPIAR